MKSTHQDRGSTHIVLIIILVVAVLGLLGVVFWQNFMNTDETNQSQTTQNTTTESDEPVAQLTTIAIEEWGVEGEYSQEPDYPMTYVYVTSPQSVYLDTLNASNECKSYGGYIYRYNANDQLRVDDLTAAERYEVNGGDTEYLIKLGDFYFVYVSPQSVCTIDDNNPDQVTLLYQIEATKDLFDSFKLSN